MQEAVIAAIDLGTDKCVTLIAKMGGTLSGLKVVGVCAVPAKGMKRSQIIDLEQATECISASLDGAERMAGTEIRSVIVSITGSHIHSQNSKGVVAVASPEQEITHSDIARVIEAARAVSLPADREIIHVLPNTFKVDSQEGIKDPVGMTGVRLEAEAHIISAMSTTMKNVQRILENLGLNVNSFVFSGLAASEAALSDTEKELGVCVVDIGAGTTSLCAYADGSLVYSGSIPIGARHVTQDIALGCRVPMDVAEQIKLNLKNEDLRPVKPLASESKQDFNARRKGLDELHLESITGEETTDVLSKRVLIEAIIAPRLTEIFDLVKERLESQKILGDIPAGVVLTGGGAETIGAVAVAKQQLKLPARLGIPLELDGLTIDIHKSAFATSIGLLLYGKAQGKVEKEHVGWSLAVPKLDQLSHLPRRMVSLFKSLIP